MTEVELKKFNCSFEYKFSGNIEVEAEDEKDAEEKAIEIQQLESTFDFLELYAPGDGEFEIDDVEEMDTEEEIAARQPQSPAEWELLEIVKNSSGCFFNAEALKAVRALLAPENRPKVIARIRELEEEQQFEIEESE